MSETPAGCGERMVDIGLSGRITGEWRCGTDSLLCDGCTIHSLRTQLAASEEARTQAEQERNQEAFGNGMLRAQVEELQSALAEAREDLGRLDWVMEAGNGCTRDTHTGLWVAFGKDNWKADYRGSTFREAIDAARASEGEAT